jgi:hypothetical protein
MVGGHELRPLFTLLFRKRFAIVAVFLIATIGTYFTLRLLKVATYDSTAIILVKIPLIDFDARIDPNPQVAPAFIDLARSDQILVSTHDALVQLRRLADPLRQEWGIEEYVTPDLREGWLPVLAKKPDLEERLAALGEGLEEEWKREILSDYRLFLALFEIKPEDIERVPLFVMQELFSAKTGIVAQTNVSIVNEPFLRLTVTWGSPGAAAVLANLWGHLLVEQTNDLIRMAGETTEDSVVGEVAKVEQQVFDLQARLAEMRADPLYQKMREAEGLENSLYGGRARLDLFGYVEAHADLSQQSGLVGELNRLQLESAAASGKAMAIASEVENSTADRSSLEAELPSLRSEALATEAAARAVEDRVNDLSDRARALREQVAEFEAEYHRTEFQSEQLTRLFSERLTTSLFSRSRLKTGYSIPPMVFANKAVPDKHPAGPKKALLSLAVGSLATLFYLCWILYAGFLVPVLGNRRPAV